MSTPVAPPLITVSDRSPDSCEEEAGEEVQTDMEGGRAKVVVVRPERLVCAGSGEVAGATVGRILRKSSFFHACVSQNEQVCTFASQSSDQHCNTHLFV